MSDAEEALSQWEAMYRSGRCFSDLPEDVAFKRALFARMKEDASGLISSEPTS